MAWCVIEWRRSARVGSVEWRRLARVGSVAPDRARVNWAGTKKLTWLMGGGSDLPLEPAAAGPVPPPPEGSQSNVRFSTSFNNRSPSATAVPGRGATRGRRVECEMNTKDDGNCDDGGEPASVGGCVRGASALRGVEARGLAQRPVGGRVRGAGGWVGWPSMSARWGAGGHPLSLTTASLEAPLRSRPTYG